VAVLWVPRPRPELPRATALEPQGVAAEAVSLAPPGISSLVIEFTINPKNGTRGRRPETWPTFEPASLFLPSDVHRSTAEGR
jgi:hypothetical protein